MTAPKNHAPTRHVLIVAGDDGARIVQAAQHALSAAPLTRHDVPARPTRRDLVSLDDLLSSALPVDPTPSLDDLAAAPDAPHLAAAQPDPRLPYLSFPVRFIVVGRDADLAAVATYLMRRDALWVELAYVPAGDSVVAASWELSSPWKTALSGSVKPVPLIRDDSSLATLGKAEITTPDGTPLVGEIIVDDKTVVSQDESGGPLFGARLIATPQSPGLIAAPMTGPSDHPFVAERYQQPKRGLFSRHRAPVVGATDTTQAVGGRAVQAGGRSLLVIRDGVAHPRPVDRVTFYRHLRDLQAVRG